MDDEESVVEMGVGHKRNAAQRILGKNPPSSPQTHSTSGIGIGFRAARPARFDTEKSTARRQKTALTLRENQQSHRKAVWDKLDEAKRKADKKAERWRAFEPEKQGGVPEATTEFDGLEEFSAENYETFASEDAFTEFPSVDFDDPGFYSAEGNTLDNETDGPVLLDAEQTVNDRQNIED